MTPATAKKWAKKIFDEFDTRIAEATHGTNIPAAFIAGLIFNEAGKDRSGNVKADATRFEPAVFARLKAVRDGSLKKYNGIVQPDIKDASDDALRALATSYQATQIMGWHVIHNLRCTIADLRDPQEHFFYTVRLLQLNGFPRNASEFQMDNEMRQWNTGRETGKTFHENYVANARAIRAQYREIESEYGKISTRLEDALTGSAAVPETETRGSATEDVTAGDPPADGTASSAKPPIEQTAENITNVSTGNANTLPDGFVPEEKTVDAPAKENSTKQATALTIAGFAVPAFLAGIIRAVQDAITNGFIDARDIGNVVLGFITNNQKYVFAGIGLVIGGMMLKKMYKQITLWIQMWIAARPDMHDVRVKPQ